MDNLPSELTPAQLEAQTILAHLLHKLQDPDSKYYAKYGIWIARHPRLAEFCFRTIRPQVWTFVQNRWSLDALKLISGDLRFEGRAIYLNGVLGLDKRVRLYIGQSANLRQRVAQHLNFRYRRDNPTLHYHAMQHSIYNSFGVLAVLPSGGMGNATLPGMDEPNLLLGLLEMWMCLVMRTLPEQLLEQWLPGDGSVDRKRKEGREGVFGGLNIACPLDQGERERVWVDLSESDDALVRSYLGLGTGEDQSEAKRKRSDAEFATKEEREMRKKEYAEKARKYQKNREGDFVVPSWVVFGVGALAAVAGVLLLNSRGGPQPRGR